MGCGAVLAPSWSGAWIAFLPEWPRLLTGALPAFLLVSVLLAALAGGLLALESLWRRTRGQTQASAARALIWMWLAWAVLLLGFQMVVGARFRPQLPDRVLMWTRKQTAQDGQAERPYLLDPFLNSQVAWDSEYYLSIAIVGYDDPAVPHDPFSGLALNHAFYPLYPLLIRCGSFFLRWLGLSPIATATLSGVLVSALGALAGILALYDLARAEIGVAGAWRAVFYLLIFPSSFFMMQVYTEGLFIGLTFSSLALLRRKYFIGAALLAVLATFTRAVGLALVGALGWMWLERLSNGDSDPSVGVFSWRLVGEGMVVTLPLLAYLLWSGSSLGQAFRIVEEHAFARGLFAVGQSLLAWGLGVLALFGTNSARIVYYLIEFVAIAFAGVTCRITFQRYPAVTMFGALVFAVSLTSGVAQGMVRYVLAVPSMFLVLAEWGQNEVFDRAWTLTSILLLGLLTTLFTFNLWVA